MHSVLIRITESSQFKKKNSVLLNEGDGEKGQQREGGRRKEEGGRMEIHKKEILPSSIIFPLPPSFLYN